MKTVLMILALVLISLALDRAVTLTEVHSPAPTPDEWQRFKETHRKTE